MQQRATCTPPVSGSRLHPCRDLRMGRVRTCVTPDAYATHSLGSLLWPADRSRSPLMGCATSAALTREHPPRPHETPQRPSPATQLYRHALESVLAFCSLKDLHAAIAVSREWAAAVESMRSIRAFVQSSALIPRLAGSRLSRHVHDVRARLSCAALRALSDRLPWLRSCR